MIKKLFTLLLVALAFVQYATAANGLWLEKRDGSIISYLFEQEVRIAYTRDSVELITDNATVQYPFDEVKRVSFYDSSSDDVKMPGTEVQQQIRLVANGVEFSGFAAGTRVAISHLSGSSVANKTTDANGRLLIRKSDLPKGVIIIKADKTSIKFINK